MYQFVNAICLSRSIGSQWAQKDLSNILVFDIFNTYTKVYLVLSNPLLPANVNVDMDTLREQYSSYDDTLANLLILIGNTTLSTVPTVPDTTVKFAKYSDAFRSEYKIDITSIGIVPPLNYPDDAMLDLEVTRPKYGTDMSLIHSHCLVSVNGFYHMTDTDGTKAYVYQGAKTMRKSKNNQMGILSFLDVGALTKIKLNPANIIPVDAGSHLIDKLQFSVTENLDNKSYILVLGGYMIFPEEGVFWRNGQNSFAVDLKQMPYIERLYESSLYIDQTDLGLTAQIESFDGINVPEVQSDDVIKKYFTLSQSYMVLVDIPNMVTNKIFIRHADLPGMFTSYTDPTYPLIVNYGRVAEYWKTLEDGYWAVSVQDSFLRNYIVSQQPVTFIQNITGNLVPNRPFYHSRGFLLEIAGFQI